MQCGHCGSQVNPGFFVCIGCGAHAQKKASLGAFFLVFFGILALFMGMAVTSVMAALVGIGMIALGVRNAKKVNRNPEFVWLRRI